MKRASEKESGCRRKVERERCEATFDQIEEILSRKPQKPFLVVMLLMPMLN